MVDAVVAAPPPAALVRRHVVLGRSVRGRPIVAIEIGEPSSPRKVLVVGCIHGNEPAGIDIARSLAQGPPPNGVDLWVVPELNPDGVAANTRQNAHGVDLNRNFPWGWRPIDPPGGTYYAGPRPLSEPESRVAAGLIRRLRPRLSIWFHQHLGLVDESGGSISLEQRFARLVHLPLRRLPRYPGSVTSWENHTLPGTSAFVVELSVGRLAAGAPRMFARAVASVAR
jgi:protein MpaA